jgi:predicted O-linked N-acetylglucosamine transferase (SPINDLY family)
MRDQLQNCYQIALELKNKGNYTNAIHCCYEGLQIDPEHIEFMSLLGECLLALGKTNQAQKCFFQIIQIQPDHSNAHAHLSKIFWMQNIFDRAIDHGFRALPAYQNNADFLDYFGQVLQRVKLYKESITYYEQSLACNPDNPLTWNRLGMVLILSFHLTDAEQVYRKALTRFPDRASLLLNLGRCLDEQGLSHQAIQYFEKVAGLTEQESQSRSNLLFALHFQPLLTPKYLYRAHKTWSNQPNKKVNITGVSSPIRIGYVSTDFRLHPVSAFVFPILKHHHQEKFQVFCYSNVLDPDIMTQRIKQLPIQWRDISNQTDQEAYNSIQKDRIHILIDLGGHSENNRLPIFAMKPSPIQITYLGYPGTTGLATMDYRITDHRADPPGNIPYNTEKLLYMPHCFLCFHTMTKFPSVNRLPALDNKHITFGSFNRLPKINLLILEVWGKILQEVPDSHILLKSISFRDHVVKNRIYSFFESMGIHKDRIHLLDIKLSIRQHLQTYHQIDIALDTYPYNGTTTTCEALMMGLPVVTFQGQAHVSRVSSSILHNVGLKECVAKSFQDYTQIAVRLAHNLDVLSQLRQSLRGLFIESPLFQWQKFVDALEDRYQRIANGHFNINN